ncbi:extracellular solute-binding protein [Thalassobacillus sp. CUG 92003]|uniref:sugar ABC transporter substrate-binding protein n=1 Tax=Thalassobacillus sp. CUG 92003 TaxID=2736641 RepID=UPI0021023D28|nr:extracellular solute-binding protein [Thalassobacillus sp. CUG 92003]
MKNTSLLRIVCLVMFIVVLAACTPERASNEDDGSDSGESSEKPEELTIWANDEDAQAEAIEDIVADFEEEEGISVNVVRKSMLDQLEELSLAGPEGKGPDLFIQPHDRIGDIVAQGLAEPLNFTDEQKQAYSEAAIDAVTYEYDGESSQYGAPAVIETYGIYYNTDILSEPPETTEDLKTALNDHTNAASDEYGFLMKPNDLYFAYPFFKNFGAYIFGGETGSYDVSDIGLNNEGAKEGGELFQSFFGNGKIPASTTTDVVDGLFTEGKVGAVINGPWSIPNYNEALGDSLKSAPFPSVNGESASTFVGVKSWMVSYYSEEKEWAKKLAMYMTNQENLKHYFEVAGELPPNPEALESIDDPIYEAFATQIESGVPMPSAPQMSQVWDPMNDALQFLAEGEDVEKVLDDAANQIEQNIEASQSE